MRRGRTPQTGVTDPGSTTGTEITTEVQPTGAGPNPYPPESPSAGLPDASPPPNDMGAAPIFPDAMTPPNSGFAPPSFDAEISVPDTEPLPEAAPDASEADLEPAVPDPAGDLAPPF